MLKQFCIFGLFPILNIFINITNVCIATISCIENCKKYNMICDEKTDVCVKG